MEKQILQQGNVLASKIREFEEALNCFEWSPEPEKTYSTNPRLIIEYDGDGREQVRLPMNLSEVLTDFLKQEIKKGLAQAQSEFDAL